MDEEILNSIGLDQVYDSKAREEIKSRFNYYYPYEKDATLRVKMTVSELKKIGQFIDEEQSEKLFPDRETSHDKEEASLEVDAIIPNFIRGKEAVVSGTDRGTLYHKVLELLDLTKVNTKEDLLRELDEMVSKQRVSEQDVKKLKHDYIFGFTQSEVADRMKKAQAAGKLFKEKQFVIGIKANEIMMDQDSEELILIQGIVDVFFEENGELILLDYKSDIVENEIQLKKRYEVQLIYYRRALEQILKKKVKEMIIYSLPLGKEIRIEEI